MMKMKVHLNGKVEDLALEGEVPCLGISEEEGETLAIKAEEVRTMGELFLEDGNLEEEVEGGSDLVEEHQEETTSLDEDQEESTLEEGIMEEEDKVSILVEVEMMTTTTTM